MDESIAKEIEKLKKDLSLEKEKIKDIKKLANKEIDRSFPPDWEGLSEKELDSYLEEYLGSLDKSFDPIPDKMSFTSHRKILGKPIIFLKKLLLKASGVFINLILDKQKKFNQQSIAFYRVILLRIGRNRKKIKHIEQRISECEANLVVLSKKLEELSYHNASEKDE